MNIQLLHGDCLDLLKTLPENSVDSIVTDPPYGLSFMGKKWDYDVPGIDIWCECLRVLKPGGYLLSFAGTRTQHRMACNIEDAGFEIRDMIAWVYGSGFPKGLSIGKAVDKLLGNEREIVGDKPYTTQDIIGNAFESQIARERPRLQEKITKGTSPFEGYGTALKPALEPITMARKPLSEKTVAENVLKHGTGGINIDASRIKTEAQETSDSVYKRLSYLYSLGCTSSLPVSLCRDYFQHILFALNSYNTNGINHLHNAHDQDGSQTLDALTAQTIVKNLFPSGVWCGQNDLLKTGFQFDYPVYFRSYGEQLHKILEAAQDGVQKLNDVLSDIYSQKYEQQRIQPNQCNDHPSSLDDFLQFVSYLFLFILHKDTKYLSHQQINNSRFPANLIHDGSDEVVELFPHSTSGEMNCVSQGKNYGIYGKYNPTNAVSQKSEGSASRFFYCAKASKSERNLGLEDAEFVRHADGNKDDGSGGDNPRNRTNTAKQNFHPTVKPVNLMRHLVKLVTPKGGTTLDPFTGSGTTGIAAKLEGFNFIGIEREADYCEIARSRIEAWKEESIKENNQLSMF